jgi:hypothetical protein
MAASPENNCQLWDMNTRVRLRAGCKNFAKISACFARISHTTLNKIENVQQEYTQQWTNTIQW